MFLLDCFFVCCGFLLFFLFFPGVTFPIISLVVGKNLPQIQIVIKSKDCVFTGSWGKFILSVLGEVKQL